MLTTSLLATGLLPLLASAHFELVYPEPRGTNEDTMNQFPCGGQNDVSSTRTQFPLTGGPIQLDMGHTRSNVSVVLALGNDPNDAAFNYTIVAPFSQSGPQDFCIGAGAIVLPSDANITDGTNATLVVFTNGDSGPGSRLYNCADITFTSEPLTTAQYDENCRNSTGTGVGTDPLPTDALTLRGDDSQTTSSTHDHDSGDHDHGDTAATGGAQAMAPMVAGWALGAVGLVAGLAAL